MDIRVDFEEAYRYLGCTGAPDGEALAELRRAAALVLEAARPKHIEKICAVGPGRRGAAARVLGVLPFLRDARQRGRRPHPPLGAARHGLCPDA